MTAPWFKTRVDVAVDRVLIEAEILGDAPLSAEAAARLRSELAEAVEERLERFWGASSRESDHA